MKIALSQINPIIGDIDYNKDKIIEQVSIAKSQEADLVVFGEMAICGAPAYDMVMSEGFVEKSLLALSEIAEFSKGIDILIGVPVISESEVFNSVLHLANGEIANEFTKAMVVSREEMPFISGIESENFPESADVLQNIISIRDERVFVAIGEDIDYIDELDVFNGLTHFSAIVNITAQRYYHYCGYESIRKAQDRSKALGASILSVNLVGGNGDVIHYGGSFAVNSKGDFVAKAKVFEEDLLIVDTYDIDLFKGVPMKKPTPKAKTKELHSALVCSIRDFFAKSGFKRACIGLSGGIDSALVASLAVEALGKECVDVLLMPSQFSSNHSVSDAIALADKLGIKYHKIDIEPLFDSFKTSLSPIFGNLPFDVAEENLQSRIRGVLTMAFSNKFNALVLNTTNKCEAAMGYGTLYGDTNGAISVLGDVYKGEVYDICRLINSESEIIPQNIIDKAPSAELRPNQKDSDTLPAYEVLDKILYGLIEECKTIQELCDDGFELSVVKKVNNAIRINEYKRYQIPPVIRVSKIVLGKDIILPILSKI